MILRENGLSRMSRKVAKRTSDAPLLNPALYHLPGQASDGLVQIVMGRELRHSLDVAGQLEAVLVVPFSGRVEAEQVLLHGCSVL